jgi:3-deoxy-D-manno-octulosonic-acid transferase
LKSFGFKNVSISGDTRFDRVAKIAESSKDIPIVNKFKGNNFLIIAGSTWKPDEELIIRFINQNDNIKFIIAPHEVSGPNINRIIQLLKKQAVRFSEINESNAQTADVIVIDSVGFLSSLYKYGEIAYIGGGFGVGIHNILEAATFGLPVVFGPNHEKFREARNLKSLNGAFSIRNFDELDTIFRTLIGDQAILKKTSLVVRNYVADNIGATQVIIETAFCKKS